MEQIVTAVIVGLLALMFAVLSVRQFCQKGKVLNSAYLFASPKERETMELRPLYRQSGIVFALLSGLFVLLTAEILCHTRWLMIVFCIFCGVTVLYALVSSFRSNTP